MHGNHANLHSNHANWFASFKIMMSIRHVSHLVRHMSHLVQLGETCVSPFSIPGSNTDYCIIIALAFNCACVKSCMMTIYIIIRHCPGVGAFPQPFCVPNSVALASLTLQVGDWAIH